VTTKPELKLGSHLVPGLAAVALFAVLAVVFLQASFGEPAGFPADANITASIGYAMFNITEGVDVASESFLVAFEIIDLVLVAALAAAVMLARRETDGALMEILADGGREVRSALGGDDREDER
jgi:NADH-quinone oxidoreductase subunit J